MIPNFLWNYCLIQILINIVWVVKTININIRLTKSILRKQNPEFIFPRGVNACEARRNTATERHHSLLSLSKTLAYRLASIAICTLTDYVLKHRLIRSSSSTTIDKEDIYWYNGQSVRQWSRKSGFKPRLSRTKDSKNAIWCLLA